METPDAIQTVPPPLPAQPGIDPSGTPSTDPGAALAEKLQRASAAAVEQHLSETKKRKPGQRGPDKKPRKPRVPLAPMAQSSDPTLLEESQATPLEPFLPDEPTFDEEAARTLIEIGCGLLNEGASEIVRAIAKKETGDQKLADDAASAVRMNEKIESAVKTGAIMCARKYSVNTAYAPEVILGGALVIWAGTVGKSINALRTKGAELRERAQKLQQLPQAA